MANTVSNVSTGKPAVVGAVFWAPLGTTLPTSANAVLDEAFIHLGYISDDGVTNTKSRETTEIKAWGGDIVAKPQNGKTDQLKMKFIEALNKDVLSVVHGTANVTGTLATGLTVHENSKELDHGCWVVDMLMTGDIPKRIVAADGQVTEVGDVVYKDDEAIGYDCTIDLFPSNALDGDSHKEYIG